MERLEKNATIKGDGKNIVKARPRFAAVAALTMSGWVCGILTLIVWAINGRVPWAVPIICAPIFAFLGYGIVKALPNIK